MKTRVEVVLEKTDAGGYSAYTRQLDRCIATGQSLQSTKKNIQEAIEFHLEGLVEEGEEIPEVFKNEYELDFRIDVSSLFEWFSGVLTKSGVSKLTGLNQSLLSQYANGMKTPSSKQTQKIEHALHNFGQELLEIQL